jgi:hypothetical protein
MVRVFLIGLLTGGAAVCAALWPRPSPPPRSPVCTATGIGPHFGPSYRPHALWGAWDEQIARPWRHVGERMSLFSAGELVIVDLHGLHNGGWDADEEFVVLRTGAGDTRYRYTLERDRLTLLNPCEQRLFLRVPRPRE